MIQHLIRGASPLLIAASIALCRILSFPRPFLQQIRMIASALIVLLIVASAALTWIDLRQGLLPDWLNLTIGLAGLARVAALDGSAGALIAGCEGVLVGAIVWALRRLYFSLRGYQ